MLRDELYPYFPFGRYEVCSYMAIKFNFGVMLKDPGMSIAYLVQR